MFDILMIGCMCRRHEHSDDLPAFVLAVSVVPCLPSSSPTCAGYGPNELHIMGCPRLAHARGSCRCEREMVDAD